MKFIKIIEKKVSTKSKKITPNLDIKKDLTEIATNFRQKHKKYLGFLYMHSTTANTHKKISIAKFFIKSQLNHSIDLDDYFDWFFTEKIKSIKTVQFYFAISRYDLSDYLLYLKQHKYSSFDKKLEQGAYTDNHATSQENYFTLNQIPTDLAESKKRQSLGSYHYAADLKANNKIIIRGQIKKLQELSSKDKSYIKELAKSSTNSFLSRLHVA